ncbi:hypothetical protein [Streptococcus suis]|uniref:hypothetical protein n=1 Tax=Streptococcus suis TaxID=1307 RepID=UPI001962257D|nr:hypothetical protein [Streptococcus suis]MBM7285162.1 hypothetical protein [Streptococcus suis]MBO3643383.1 hypothetical protein [Streptococcus suis]MCO8238342.1 hypothetical protein [Streptococcus suis]HEM3534027.1 hypothetical protein [Streptococcus suis]
MEQNKHYKWSRDIIIPLLTFAATTWFAFSANSISDDILKITQNSDIFRYYIQQNGTNGISIKTTSGILRKISYIKYSNGDLEAIQFEDGTFAEEQTDEKIEVNISDFDGFLSQDGDKLYMFVWLEGGDASRDLKMLVFDEKNSLKVYDRIEALNPQNTSMMFNDFKLLYEKLSNDGLLNQK